MEEVTKYLIKSTVENNEVRVWSEEVAIPTYEIGQPEKNPIFLEKRVYQGSSGVVYPYPVIEKIADEKHDIIYNAVFLENEYIKIMILPDLGADRAVGLFFFLCYFFFFFKVFFICIPDNFAQF